MYPLFTAMKAGQLIIRYVCVLLCCDILVVFYGIVVNFVGIKLLWIMSSFLYMIIYEGVYTWCLRNSIWSTWFLDKGISTCL